MNTVPAWMRLAKDDYRGAAARDDVDLVVLRDHETVEVAPPRAGDCDALLPRYSASAIPVVALAESVVTADFQVFTRRGELVRESVPRRSLGEAALMDPSLIDAIQQADVADSTVAVLGTHRAANYFHWWLDSVARVWLIAHALGMDHLTWLVPRRERHFHRESLDLLGIGLAPEPVAPQPRAYSRVVFTPGLAYGAAQCISPLVAQFAGYLQARIIPSSTTRRLYVTRRSARFRRVLNEDALSDALGRAGFEMVDLNSLSVVQQAEMFNEAQTVIGVHGASLANLLFARPGTGVVELFPHGALHSSCYRHLASLLSQPYAPLEARAHSATAPGDLKDDLVVDIDRVLKILERLDRNLGRRRA